MTYCLQDDKVLLRPFDLDDLEWLKDQRNDAEQMAGSYQVWPLSGGEQQDWFSTAYRDGTQKRFIIETAHSGGDRAGTIALTHIDPRDGGAELGIRIAAGYRRRGYASAAIRLLTKWGFEQARLHRLYSEVFACNEASMRLFEKCGWHLWGTKSYAHWQGGKWHNVYCFETVHDAITLNEWVSNKTFVGESADWALDGRATGVRVGSEPMVKEGKNVQS